MHARNTLGRQLPRIALMGLFLSSFVTLAQAVTIGTDTTIFAVSEPDPAVGGIVVKSSTVDLIAPTFTGKLTSEVISGDTNNPWNADGGLTFTYKVENFGPNSLSRFTISDFATFLTDVSYLVTGGQIPTLIDRGPGTGDVLGFSFIGGQIGNGKILPNTTSALLVIQTDSKDSKVSFASVINGSTAMAPSYAPTSIVPEPSSLLLAGIGAIGCVGLVWRRRGLRS